MQPMDRPDLPGSRHCVGCNGLTFRNRGDGLCPRCAYQAENLIEQIEIESISRDLALMSQFEAYCRQRDLAGAGATRPGFAFGDPLFAPDRLSDRPFSAADGAGHGEAGGGHATRPDPFGLRRDRPA